MTDAEKPPGEDKVSQEESSPSQRNDAPKYEWRFWAILGALSFTSMLSALDISVISTALPTIIHELGSSPAYAWVANAYFLTSTAFQPIFGQAANIYGRRSLTMISVVLFAIGSAVSGSARTVPILIAGRTIQGVGGGGINVLVELIVCDLVPLRDRAKFMGIIFSAFAVAIAIGPVIGGVISDRSSWRWIFYLNLPVSGVALAVLFLFLQVKYKKDTALNSIKRVDFVGNGVLVAAVVAILLALTWGGTDERWDSWRTLVPLILGIVGLIGFLAIESTNIIAEPTTPLRLFSNRTSLGAYGLTFVHAALTYWISYFLPLYFQSLKEQTPSESGVDFLPSAIAPMPFAIATGIGVSKFNRYRPFHFIGFCLLSIAFGLFTLLDERSSTGYWLGIQFISSAGLGVLFTTTLPAVQAPLPEEDTAVATATWGFVRSFGGIWGVAIPSAIFNSHVNSLVSRVQDENLRAILVNGGAYAIASKSFMRSLNSTPNIKQQVVDLYTESLKLSWQVGIAFALLGIVIALFIKEVPMREELNTEFGIADGEKDDKPDFEKVPNTETIIEETTGTDETTKEGAKSI